MRIFTSRNCEIHSTQCSLACPYGLGPNIKGAISRCRGMRLPSPPKRRGQSPGGTIHSTVRRMKGAASHAVGNPISTAVRKCWSIAPGRAGVIPRLIAVVTLDMVSAITEDISRAVSALARPVLRRLVRVCDVFITRSRLVAGALRHDSADASLTISSADISGLVNERRL